MNTPKKAMWLASTLLLCTLAMVPAHASDLDGDWLAYGPQENSGNFQGGPMQEGGFNPRRMQGGGMAQGGGQMQGGPRGGGGPGQMLSQLNLSAEQRQKMQALMQKNRANGQQGRQTLMQKRQQLRTMMQSGSGNKEQAMALLGEINKLQSAQMAGRIGMMYEMKSILTPEQFQQFQSTMQQKRGQSKNMRGGGMGRGGMKGSGMGGEGGFGPRGQMGDGGRPASDDMGPGNDGF